MLYTDFSEGILYNNKKYEKWKYVTFPFKVYYKLFTSQVLKSIF